MLSESTKKAIVEDVVAGHVGKPKSTAFNWGSFLQALMPVFADVISALIAAGIISPPPAPAPTPAPSPTN
jgi:hypothetical protein